MNLYTRFLLPYEAYLSFSNDIERTLKEISEGKFTTGMPYYDSLIEVKDEETYLEWYKKWSQQIPSNRIKRFKTFELAEYNINPLERFCTL